MANKCNNSMLTNRETEVLSLASEGLVSKEIANKLYVSEQTVGFHLGNVYKKLQVGNRFQAIIQAIKLGIISPIGLTETD